MIKSIKETDTGKEIKIIVGGSPVNEEFANNIGADGYAPNASLAVNEVKRLIGK